MKKCLGGGTCRERSQTTNKTPPNNPPSASRKAFRDSGYAAVIQRDGVGKERGGGVRGGRDMSGDSFLETRLKKGTRAATRSGKMGKKGL